MGLFKHIGDEIAEAVHLVHPDRQGESVRNVEPGETVEAAENPDPARFEPAEAGDTGDDSGSVDAAVAEDHAEPVGEA